VTEVWFRNPVAYIRELVECEQGNIAWDRGVLIKRKIDPLAHASLYFGRQVPYRVLAVGPQGTAEYRADDKWERPTAVYPTWQYGEDAALLEDMIENPAGQTMSACNAKVPGDEKPVWGQEHRVVVIGLPSSNAGPGRKMLRYLKELQECNPQCILHLHGLYGFRPAFGMGFASADVDPRAAAAKGKVHMPSGSEMKFEETVKHAHWVKQLDMLPVDLKVPRNRCIFNIRSACWAGKNYGEMFAFRLNGKTDYKPDTTTPDAEYKPPQTLTPFLNKNQKALPGDKVQCNVCSLQLNCKHFRNGAVCSLPDAEPKRLADYFHTRDSSQIIDGLGILMSAGTNRLEQGMRYEEIDGELSPEVTKMINSLFSQGVQLAKLVDPSLRPGIKVNVGVNGNAAVQINQGSQKSLVAGIIRQLEAQGIKREDITPRMVEGVLASMQGGTDAVEAIEGTVVASQTEQEKSA
jgi:hypothetical protein